MTGKSDDPRPAVAIGHVGPHTVGDLAAATAFYVKLGCRLVAELESLTVLELRGGTHIILRRGEPRSGERASFDLMVDDLDATHADFSACELHPTSIVRGKIHDHFTVTDPAGWVVTITSSHAVGPV